MTDILQEAIRSGDAKKLKICRQLEFLQAGHSERREVLEKYLVLSERDAKLEILDEMYALAQTDTDKLAVLDHKYALAQTDTDKLAVLEFKISLAQTDGDKRERKQEKIRFLYDSLASRTESNDRKALLLNLSGMLADLYGNDSEELRRAQKELEADSQSLPGAAGAAAFHRGAEAESLLFQRLDRLQVAVDDVKRSQAPATTPTPATAGKQTQARLVAEGHWNPIQQDGGAVLTEEEATQLKQDATNRTRLQERHVNGEWVVVEGLTPKLKDLIAEAAEAIGVPLTLVNSERHFWAVDPHGGAASAPDLFVTHPAMWKEDTSEADERVKHEGFCFGLPASWDCRDCIEVLGEAKVEMGPNEFSAIGEVLDYLGRIAHQRKVEGNTRITRVQSGRAIVFDAEKFYLLRAVSGFGTDCKHGKWTDQGSAKAIVDFVASPLDRVWSSELEAMCKRANLRMSLPEPGSKRSCVIGSGAFGRVFRALDEAGESVALKLSLDQRGVDAISSEIRAYELPGLKAAGVTTTMIQNLQNGVCSAALVIRPVGVPLPRNQTAIASALLGLWGLSQHGLCHGDARHANVIWIESENKALWTDLHTLSAVSPSSALHFQADVTMFAESLNVTKDAMEVAKAATAAMEAGRPPLLALKAIAKDHLL